MRHGSSATSLVASASLSLWQADMDLAIVQFLEQVKTEVLDAYAMQPLPVFLSYAPVSSGSVDLSPAVEQLQRYLGYCGIPVLAESWQGASAFRERLERHRFAILLCTKAYVQAVREGVEPLSDNPKMPAQKTTNRLSRLTSKKPLKERLGKPTAPSLTLKEENGSPGIAGDSPTYQAIEAFGARHKNALQPLLCEGGFSDTAFQMVDKRYLVRNYKGVLNQDPTADPLRATEAMMEVLFPLSGAQGLGLLPDLLGLRDKEHQQAEQRYRALFQTLREQQASLTLHYRLARACHQTILSHPFRAHIADENLAVLKDLNTSDPLGQKPGFDAFLDRFLDPDQAARIALLLCQSSADVQLSDLALMQSLEKREGVYTLVFSIDCARYAGKAAQDCVRLALRDIGIRQLSQVRDRAVVLLLKGYQDLGAYDNLYLQNQLSAWPHLKVLVTCRADFFRARGYLSCFLSMGSDRKIEDLWVQQVPAFASQAAQMIAIPSLLPKALDAGLAEALSPKRVAQQSELSQALLHLRSLCVGADLLSAEPARNPQIFISYAWEPS